MGQLRSLGAQRLGLAAAVILVLTGCFLSAMGASGGPAGGKILTRVLSPLGPDPPLATYPLAQRTAYPLGITTDSRGNVWFAEDNIDQIAELIPANSTYRYFPIPTEQHLAWIWFLKFDNSGNLWFSDESQPLLWRLSQKGGFANFSAGTAQPYALAYDPASSRIWFTSIRTNQVGYFAINGGDAVLGQVTTIAGNSPGPEPSGISLGPDGNVFVAETFDAKIAELAFTNLSVLGTWTLPVGAEPVGLAYDPLLGRVWFTNHATSFFGYVSLGSKGYVEYPTSLSTYGGSPIVTLPYWITVGPGGQVWFDEHFANRIARFDPATQQLTEFPIPQNDSSPLRIWLDSTTGELWFSEFAGNAIGVVPANSSVSQSVRIDPKELSLSPSGDLSAAPSPAPNSAPTFSSTSVVTGDPYLNFSVTQGSNGSITISTKVADPGNYTLGICYQFSSTDQCGYATLVVEGSLPPVYFSYGLYAGLAGVAAIILVLLYRESARRPSSESGAAKRPERPAKR